MTDESPRWVRDSSKQGRCWVRSVDEVQGGLSAPSPTCSRKPHSDGQSRHQTSGTECPRRHHTDCNPCGQWPLPKWPPDLSKMKHDMLALMAASGCPQLPSNPGGSILLPAPPCFLLSFPVALMIRQSQSMWFAY